MVVMMMVDAEFGGFGLSEQAQEIGVLGNLLRFAHAADMSV